MRRVLFWTIFLCSILGASASAQYSQKGYLYVSVAPAGSCTSTAPLEIFIPTGVLYTCQNGSWGALGGSGGSGTVTSVTFTGDGVIDSATPSTAVTTSGTVTATVNSVAGHKFIGNNGSGSAALAAVSVGTSDTTPNQYAADTGAVNAYVVTLSPAMTALTVGVDGCFKATNVNTTTNPTVAFNGLTATTIVKFNGGTLKAGDIGTVEPSCVIFDGTNFDLLNPQSTTGSGALVLANAPTFPAAISAVTYTTGTNCAVNGSGASPEAIACGAASAGAFSVAVAGAAGTAVISTTAVTANSEITVTQVSSENTRLTVTCNTTVLALAAPIVSAKSAGASFTITVPTFITNPVCFNYVITN